MIESEDSRIFLFSTDITDHFSDSPFHVTSIHPAIFVSSSSRSSESLLRHACTSAIP